MPQHGPLGTEGGKPYVGQYGSSIVGSNAIQINSLIACSGCGAVFKKDKIIPPGTDPSAFITCPMCLKTRGWEQVTT